MSVGCSVCFTPFNNDSIIVSTICGHQFHEQCLLQCNDRRCPMCRESLSSDNDGDIKLHRVYPKFSDECTSACEEKVSQLQREIKEGKQTIMTLKQGSFSADFGSQFVSGFHSDFKIIVQGKVIPAHKLILVSRSPVFMAMLAGESQENLKGELVVVDAEFGTFHDFVEFMYSGKPIFKGQEHARRLLKLADKYDVQQMVYLVSVELKKFITVENAAYYLEDGDKYNAPILKAAAVSFITRNRSSVAKTQRWIDLSQRSPLLASVFRLAETVKSEQQETREATTKRKRQWDGDANPTINF